MTTALILEALEKLITVAQGAECGEKVAFSNEAIAVAVDAGKVALEVITSGAMVCADDPIPLRIGGAGLERVPANGSEAATHRICAIAKRLYEDEINLSVSTLWDGGYDWEVGGPVNPKAAGNRHPDISPDALLRCFIDIADAAAEHYPDSDFQKWWEWTKGGTT